jgi:hypothetical protein
MVDKYDPKCIRRVSNWSTVSKYHKFDKKDFDPIKTAEDIPTYSPKLAKLLEHIEELDKKDLKNNGKLYKHFIFSDVSQLGCGVKIIASGLLSTNTWKLAYDNKLNIYNDDTLLKNKNYNFLLLCGTSVYNTDISVKKKKEILLKYNQRPENNYGELARIILLDKSYKEGIDLFDVKYVHVFEPQTSKADMKQVIGRSTRLCGQKGLEFHPTKGWPLHVFLYDVDLTDDTYPEKTLFKMYLKYSGINIKMLEFVEEIEKYSIIGSVDYELTKNIHNFKIEEDDIMPLWKLFQDDPFASMKGGAAKEVFCDKKCGERPTKFVPVNISLFATVALVLDKDIPKLKKPRSFFCSLLKNDAEFCKNIKLAWDDPIQYVKSHKKEIIEVYHSNKYYVLPPYVRNGFLKFVFSIIPKPKSTSLSVSPISAKSTLAPASTPISVKSTLAPASTPISVKSTLAPASTPISVKSTLAPASTPKSIKSELIVTEPPNKLYNFLEMRKYITENYLQYKWSKVKLENLCVPVGGVSSIVNFTPTQDFVRNYFTPESPYKGILLSHSVGTGKCHAKDTPILMFDGSIKLVQDIKIGDKLMGDDSTPRNVLELGTGMDNLYDVIDQYNHKYTVNSEHILCLIDPNGKIIEIEVNNFLKLSTENQKLYKGYRTAVDFQSQLISKDPYQIGYNITTNIPDNYKINSREIRLQVLAGIIDRYGKLNDSKDNIIITNIDFKDDLLFLARSVGLTAYVSNTTIIITGILSIIPTQILTSFNDNCSTLTSNISILFNRHDHYYGFTLDSNNRYLLGDFTVTHNTCSAIATATTSFEKENYTILWVTRSSLKSDIWKNMFDQVCNIVLQDKIKNGLNIPQDNQARMKLLSKSWAVRPISYKQFSNLVSAKNSLYTDLVKKNGKLDPLKKTLLIIDEAHKLYGGADLSGNERPDMNKLKAAIMNSYNVSKDESVKVMLMTATPITNDPMELIKLINLCKPLHSQMPDNFDDFSKLYLDEDGKFTKKGTRVYLDNIAGYISYISRENDARQFAQPIIIPVNVNIGKLDYSKSDFEKFTNKIEEEKEQNELIIKTNKDKISDIKKQRNQRIKFIKDGCNGFKGEARLNCNNQVAGEISKIDNDYEDELNRLSLEIQKVTENKKENLAELKQYKTLLKEDKSQEGVLTSKCYKNKKT